MSVTVHEALETGAKWLGHAGVEGAERDVRILLAKALDCDPTRLLLMEDDEVLPEQFRKYDEYLAAREQFQPVSQIIGGREFWSRWFKVTRDVLDPRPDTETLIELALAAGPRKRVLDLGTGSGILGITLAAEWPEARVIATDISTSALEVAAHNAAETGVDARMEFVPSDWFEMVAGKFDLIVSNPPYISMDEMGTLSPDVRNWEPFLALTPGGDGMDAYRIIASMLEQYLEVDGMALFEIGHSQGAAVGAIFRDAGFGAVTVSKDLGGHDRIVTVLRK